MKSESSESFIFEENAKDPSEEERADWIWKKGTNTVFDSEPEYNWVGLREEGKGIDPEEVTRDNILNLAEKYGIPSGKWVLDRTRSEIDREWDRVLDMMEEEDVYASKVSTKRQSDGHSGPGIPEEDRSHIVCIYTEDFRNREDVERVLEALENYDISNVKGYKEDIKTVLGIYSDNGRVDEFLYTPEDFD
ncbi:MAG: putative phosphothreonine lyase domain-containing protein [Candidatus Aenigmatarchaeota archaeon]